MLLIEGVPHTSKNKEDLSMSYFQTTLLIDELFRDLNNGLPGRFGVMREPKFEDHLALYTQRRAIPVVHCALTLQTSTGQRIVFDQNNLRGRFILDQQGTKQNPVRLLLLGEDDTPIIASDCDQFQGQIIILADQAVSADPNLFGIKAVFGENETNPSSALLCDSSKQLTKLWRLEAQLIVRGGGDPCGTAIHL